MSEIQWPEATGLILIRLTRRATEQMEQLRIWQFIRKDCEKLRRLTTLTATPRVQVLWMFVTDWILMAKLNSEHRCQHIRWVSLEAILFGIWDRLKVCWWRIWVLLFGVIHLIYFHLWLLWQSVSSRPTPFPHTLPRTLTPHDIEMGPESISSRVTMSISIICNLTRWVPSSHTNHVNHSLRTHMIEFATSMSRCTGKADARASLVEMNRCLFTKLLIASCQEIGCF